MSKIKVEVEGIDDIETMASIIVDEYLSAQFQYSFIQYSTKKDQIIDRFNMSYGAQAFDLIIFSLLENCISKMYNVVFDKDPSSASIFNIIKHTTTHKKKIENERSKIAPIHLVNRDRLEPEFAKYLEKKFAEEESEESLERFLHLYDKLQNSFKNIRESHLTPKIKGIRNKVISHPDIKRVNEKLQRRSIEEYGLKWSEIDAFISQAEELVNLANLCCASCSHMFEDSKQHYEQITKDFWIKARTKAWCYRGGVKITNKKREKLKGRISAIKKNKR